MAKHSFQEKFQVTLPPKHEAGEEWVWPPPRDLHKCMDPTHLPPLGIEEPVVESHQMPLHNVCQSDVTSNLCEGKSVKDGFTLHEMDNTDDQYTGEHVDQFYGDAVGWDDGENKYTGFVERSNYLDRL